MMIEGACYAAWVLEELFYDEEMVAIDEAYQILQGIEELCESAVDHEIFEDLESITELRPPGWGVQVLMRRRK
jgi:hypothetical protein